jgi:gluconolactonase
VAGVAAAAATAAARAAGAAEPPVSLQSTPRDWSPGGQPLRYPEPDIVALDPRFRPYMVGNTPMKRLYTGSLWAEGPAWNAAGKFLMWSDVAGNEQLRWVEDDGRVTRFRTPSGYSNGNTFDFQGRQISCEHGNRRVARYEIDGSVTTIADRFEGKRLNSPNDAVVHPDGGIWFTDPPWGILGNYEGFKAQSELPDSVYRVDPSNGRVAKVGEISRPNGICFSPDYKRLYVTNSATEVHAFDVDGARGRNQRVFARLDMPGANPVGDGLRCDRDGNLWIAAAPGVQIVNPAGERIGMIRLPERCANVCFGGPKRNRLFMTASQSLYSIYVGIQGAHIC